MTWHPASFFLLVLVSLTLVAPIVQAQNPFTEGLEDAQTTATSGGISKETDIFKIIAEVIKFLLTLSAVLAMGALVWGGIMYIMSLGDEGRAGKAKTIIDRK